MSSKNITISVIVAIVVIGIAWFFLDHRYTQPLPPDLQPAAASSTTADASANGISATPTGSGPAAPSSVSVSATPTSQSSVQNFMHTVTINTSKGTIVFETYDADAPNTVTNFITLADKGFYNGLIFHRVINGFMIQGGDPTGTGMGGPGYKFADELNSSTPSYQAGYVRGTVAMANSGPNTNGSQFFIVQTDTPLPHSYTIFGKVISGMDVVDAIAATPVDSGDKPLTPVTMTSVTVATASPSAQ